MLPNLHEWLNGKSEPAHTNGGWVLTVRAPIAPIPAIDGGVYEWGLTLISPRDDRECRIDGIWFLASAHLTLHRSVLIEQMRTEQELKATDLQVLIERNRAPESNLHVIRKIGTVKRHDIAGSAYAAEFVETLEWGGIGSVNPRERKAMHEREVIAAALQGKYEEADGLAGELLKKEGCASILRRGTTPSACPHIHKRITIERGSDNLYRLLLDGDGDHVQDERPPVAWPQSGFELAGNAVAKARERLNESA